MRISYCVCFVRAVVMCASSTSAASSTIIIYEFTFLRICLNLAAPVVVMATTSTEERARIFCSLSISSYFTLISLSICTVSLISFLSFDSSHSTTHILMRHLSAIGSRYTSLIALLATKLTISSVNRGL